MDSSSHSQSVVSKNWRTKSARSRPLRHRWQIRGNSSDVRYSRRHLRRITFLAAMLGSLILGMIFFAYLVLFAPKQTPMLTLVANDYAWPYAPNSWAMEDLNRFQELNSQSLKLFQVGQDQFRRSEWLADFSAKLSNVEAHFGQEQPLLIYISMHGAVDSEGIPCLLPPNSSPLDSSTWLPIPDLLNMLKQLAPRRDQPVLVFLDCNKTLSNWDHGLIYNSFANALAQTVDEAKIPNLIVLNSASSGQQSLTSEVLQGSIFGESVWRALRGEADRRREGGNGDRRLQTSEVVHYVQKRVQSWSLTSRGRQQTPLLLPDRNNQKTLCWALKEPEPLPAANQQGEVISQAVDDIFRLWAEFEALPRADVLRLQAPAVTRLLQELTWCEQAILAGKFYQSRVQQKLVQLHNQLIAIEQKLKRPGEDQLGDLWSLQKGPEGHTLALQTFFGYGDENTQALLQIYDQLAGDYNEQTVHDVLENATMQADRFADFHFLSMLKMMGNQATLSDRSLMQATLSAQGQSYRNSIPSDLRLVERLRRHWAELDSQRRHLEDETLIGHGQAADWQAFEKQVAASVQSLQEFASYYRLSDQSHFELPLFARWIADPAHDPQTVHLHIQLAQRVLLPAIDANRTLIEMLTRNHHQPEPIEQQNILSVAQTLRMAEKELEQAILDEAVFSTVEEGWEHQDLCSNQAILRIPFLFDPNTRDNKTGTEQRKALYQITRRMQQHLELNQRKANLLQSQIASQQPTPASQDDSLRAILDLYGSIIHMLVESNGADREHAASSNLQRSVQQLEASFRYLLNLYPVSTRELLGGALAKGENSRLVIAQAANRLRQLSSYWRPPSDSDPIEKLLRFDGDIFITSQLQRVIEDFWGGQNRLRPPFFQLAAQKYLVYLKTNDLLVAELKIQRDQLEKQLTERVHAAQRGLKIVALPNLVIDDEIFRPFDLTVESGDAAAFRALPALEGQLLISDTDRQLKSIPQRVTIHPQDKTAAPDNTKAENASPTFSQAFEVQTNFLAEQTTIPEEMQAVLQFRGHEFNQKVPLIVPHGQFISVKHRPSNHATVSVVDEQAQSVSIMLVLDCSQSMQEAISWESQENQLSKFNAAVIATDRILQTLSNLPNARVGMVLYGHRVGWNTASPNQILRQTTYANVIPDELMPYADVEIALPFGRFGKTEAQQLQTLLQTVQPWGETPLYLSIQEAFREMNAKNRGGRQQIIVITDGRNQQLNPSPDKDVTLNQLLSENFGETVINIVGFGINPAESTAAAREFQQLARRTGGEYVEINNAVRLLRKVDEYFARREFSVSSSEGTKNQTVGQTIHFDRPQPYQSATVNYSGLRTQLQLNPGDLFQLLASENSQRFKSVVYSAASPRFANLDGGTADNPLMLGVHRPLLQQGTLQLELSIQGQNQQPVTKPLAYRVLLNPIYPDGQRDRDEYVVTGNSFQPDKPVPVISLQAADWPREATSVEVTAWIQQVDSPTRNNPSFSLSQLEQHKPLEPMRYEISHTAPETLILVRQLKEATIPQVSISLEPVSDLVSISTEIDLTGRFLIERYRFAGAITAAKLKSLRFRVMEPDQDGWLNNVDRIITVPINQQTGLKPQLGPLYVP